MPQQSPIKFLPQGAILQEFNVAGHNIVISFPSAAPYLKGQYFGETIGRVANRIKDGKVDNLNGRPYQLAVNKGVNHLHGGKIGWGKKTFRGPEPLKRNGRDALRFTYVSPDGEEAYPGTVELQVFYTVCQEREEDAIKTVLEAEYQVELIGQECEETMVNVTNHSYFNLSGSSTIQGTEATLSTADHLVSDENGIPLGPIEPFPGIEAGQTVLLGEKEPDIDHCFVMDRDIAAIPLDTRARELRRLVSLFHPSTRLHLDVFSTEPAFQFYTGKHISVAASEHGPERGAGAGLCVEPGRFTNAINVPGWRDMVALRQGQRWGARTVYKAWEG